MKRLLCLILFACVAAGSAIASTARAAEKVDIAYYGSDNPLAVFIAQEQGYFAKNGIDAHLTLLGGSSVTTPATLVANTYQIGMATMPTILLARQSGIDLKILAATVVNEPGYHLSAIVVRPDLDVKTAKDFEGKSIGVPGLNNFIHILLVKWLQDNGADTSKIHFVEAFMPQMGDLLRAHQVDAVVPAEPYLGQITQSGTGRLVAYFTDSLPAGVLAFTWVVTADYAAAHPEVVKGFRAAVAEGLAYYHAHPETSSATLAHFTRIPLAVIEKIPRPPYDNTVNVSQTAFWVDVMTKQKLLNQSIDPASLLLP